MDYAGKFSGDDSGVSEFLRLYSKSREIKEGKPCGSGEDCPDLLSSCCGAILSTVFGTLPLQVECVVCKQIYLLKDVISK